MCVTHALATQTLHNSHKSQKTSITTAKNHSHQPRSTNLVQGPHGKGGRPASEAEGARRVEGNSGAPRHLCVCKRMSVCASMVASINENRHVRMRMCTCTRMCSFSVSVHLGRRRDRRQGGDGRRGGQHAERSPVCHQRRVEGEQRRGRVGWGRQRGGSAQADQEGGGGRPFAGGGGGGRAAVALGG